MRHSSALFPLLTFLGLAGTVAAALPPEPVTETATEFTTSADLDGNGTLDPVVVDKVSGQYRLGRQTTTTLLTWLAARPSGLSPVTGFSTGPLLLAEPADVTVLPANTNRDDLVFASPAANRLNVINGSPDLANPQPVAVFPTGLAPDFVVAVDHGGPGANPWLDLFSASTGDNSPNPFHLGLIRGNGSTFSNRLDSVIPAPLSHGNRLLPRTNSLPFYAAALSSSPSERRLLLFDLTAGTARLDTSITNLPPLTEYAAGTFSNRALLTFLIYLPGSSTVNVHPLAEPAPNDFELNPAPATTLTFGTNRLLAVQVLSGGPNAQLGIIANQGQLAEIYAYNGLGAATRVAQFNAQPAQPFTRFAGAGPGTVHLLSGPNGISASCVTYGWNGTSYTPLSTSLLPRLAPAALQANVAQYQREPFVDPSPALLALNAAGDWASAPIFGTNRALAVTNRVLNVSAESLVSAQSGLGNPIPASFATEPDTTHALVAQYTESIAIAPLTAPLGRLVSDLSVSPPAGNFNAGISVTLRTANPTDVISFRTNGSPWTPYTAALVVYRDTALEAYGRPATGNGRSPLLKATYTFTLPWYAIDSDGDGVPDFTEEERGLSPFSGDDGDGDGFRDFDEILSGSNPANAASQPGTNHAPASLIFPVVLDVTPQPFAVPPPAAGAAPGTPITARALQGTLLASAPLVGKNAQPPGVQLLLNFTAGSLVSVATPEHFTVSPARIPPTEPSGRELLGLLAVPPPSFTAVPFVPPITQIPQTLSQVAAAWTASANTFIATNPPPLVETTLFPIDVLVGALLERKLDELLSTNDWPRSNRLTLFPHRPADAGRTNPPTDILAKLGSPVRSNAWYLPDLLADLDQNARSATHPQVVQLRLLNAALYGTCTFSNVNTVTNGTNVLRLSTFPPLLDSLRSLVESNALPAPYASLPLFPASFVSNAAAGARIVLDAALPRPRVAVSLVVQPGSFQGACGVLQDTTGASVALLDRYRRPYFPGSAFEVPPGSVVRVIAFEDVPIPDCAQRALEVLALALVDVPPGTAVDTDADGLDDAWELAFLGGTLAENGDTDHDGDLFNNRAEFEGGTDPANRTSLPPGPPPGSRLATDGIPATPEGDAAVVETGDGSLDVATDGSGENGASLDGTDTDGLEVGLDESTGDSAPAAFRPGPRLAQPAAGAADAFPGSLVYRSFGKLGADTNRPLVVTRLAFADQIVSVTSEASALGSRSNRVLVLGRGQRLLTELVLSNSAVLRIRGKPPAGPNPNRSAAPAGVASTVGNFVSQLATLAANATEAGGKAVATVVKTGAAAADAAVDTVSDAVNDAVNSGEEDKGDPAEFTTWPHDLLLPGGGVVSNVTTLVFLPLNPSSTPSAINRVSVRSTEAGSFRLRQAGLVREGFAYAGSEGSRIRGTRAGDGESTFALTSANTTGPTGLRLRLLRSLDLDALLESATLRQLNPPEVENPAPLLTPDLDLPSLALGQEAFVARLTARTSSGILDSALTAVPETNQSSRLELALGGAALRSAEVVFLKADGSEACRFPLASGSLGRLAAGAKLVGFQSDLPALGALTRAFQFRLTFAAPVNWTHPVTGESCTGQALIIRIELRRPVRLLQEPPRVVVRGPATTDGTYPIQPTARRDWGDAPDLPYPTLASRSGANHRVVRGLRLGRRIDPERQGQPSRLALGDDQRGLDDDDGIAFLTPLLAGKAASVAVGVRSLGGPARLDAFFDFNADGDWTDAGEQVFASRSVSNGVNQLTFTLPPGATNRASYARFRLSSAGGLTPTGAAADGEVEDYRIRLGVTNRPVVIRSLAFDAEDRAVLDAPLDAEGIFTLESIPGLGVGGEWAPESLPLPGDVLGTKVLGDPVGTGQRLYRLRQE